MFSVSSVTLCVDTRFKLFTIPVFITRKFERNTICLHFLSNICEMMWGCSLSRIERTTYGKLNWETLSYSRTEKNQNLSQLVIACLPHRVWGWSTPPTAIPSLPLSSLSVLPHCSHSAIPHFTHSFLCPPSSLLVHHSLINWCGFQFALLASCDSIRISFVRLGHALHFVHYQCIKFKLRLISLWQPLTVFHSSSQAVGLKQQHCDVDER